MKFSLWVNPEVIDLFVHYVSTREHDSSDLTEAVFSVLGNNVSYTPISSWVSVQVNKDEFFRLKDSTDILLITPL